MLLPLIGGVDSGDLPLPPLLFPSALTNPVREPAIEKGLVGWAALRQAEVSLPLQCFERAQQHGFTTGFPANRQENIQRRQRALADSPIGNQVGIILAIIYLRKQPPNAK
jgi:hypothetical protein